MCLMLGIAAPAGSCQVDTECDQCAGELCFTNVGAAQGFCKKTHDPVVCDDANACTTDACTPSTGQCTHDAVASCCLSDADCDACTGLGCSLDSHTCGLTSSALACDDHDVCTADVCDAAGAACRHDPLAGCCHPGDDAACADDDSCTDDACADDATCHHTPKQDVAAIVCLCNQTPTACTDVKLPHRVVRRYTRGCEVAAHAAQRKGARKRKLLARSAHLFRHAAISAARIRRKSVPLECRLSLGTLLGTVQGRANALRNK